MLHCKDLVEIFRNYSGLDNNFISKECFYYSLGKQQIISSKSSHTNNYMAQNQSPKPIEANNPVMNFVQDFHLNYNKLGIVHFEATINYKVANRIFKMHQTNVHIKNSGAQPMDIISLINPDIDSTMYPTIFFYAADEISYMPNQFLIIKGNSLQHGDYNVLIFPRV